MQFEFRFGPTQRKVSPADSLAVAGRNLRLEFVRHRRARRYVLRLAPDGTARVTVPRGGSCAEAKRFAERNAAWLERQLLRRALQPPGPQAWVSGTEILFRGQRVPLELNTNGESHQLRLGEQMLHLNSAVSDLRPQVERYLWRLARRELSARVFEIAHVHKFIVQRVSVRNQRSRWGSCSRRGTISLNWRLIQAPDFVRDYIILHELAHLREMNHSSRFWGEVARLCPDFAQAERWLKEHGSLLR